MSFRNRQIRDIPYNERKSPLGSTIKILFYLFLLIFNPVLIFLLTRKKQVKELDDICNDDIECAKGLKCLLGKCTIEPCEKPAAPTGILHVGAPGAGGVDVTIVWSWVPYADAYLIFMGETEDFDPFEGSIYSTISKEPNRLFEDLPYDEEVFVKIIAVSNNCGLSKSSDAYSFTTMSSP